MSRKFFNGIDVQSQRIINVASPSTSTDAANKSYVDGLVNGLSWHPACDAATTANVTLSTGLASGQVIDGVTLATGQRVLVKNQTTGSQNGIYVVPASGAASLAADSTQGELTEQATVRIESGTVNAGLQWTLTTADPITVGTTSQTWVNSSGSTYTAGNGISITSGTIAAVATTGIVVNGSGIGIDSTVVVRKYATTVGDGTSTSIVVTHSLGTQDVHVLIYDFSGAPYAEDETDVQHTSSSQVTLVFATAPASSSLRVVVFG